MYPGSFSEFFSKLSSIPLPVSEIADLVRHYIQWGVRFGIRSDVAWAQMLFETDNLRYTGNVRREQNNFCGLKTHDGSAFASFTTPELGVIAHYAHLACYCFPEHVRPECSDAYDPRHKSPHYDWAWTVGDLSGKWAPSSGYAAGIVERWSTA